MTPRILTIVFAGLCFSPAASLSQEAKPTPGADKKSGGADSKKEEGKAARPEQDMERIRTRNKRKTFRRGGESYSVLREDSHS